MVEVLARQCEEGRPGCELAKPEHEKSNCREHLLQEDVFLHLLSEDQRGHGNDQVGNGRDPHEEDVGEYEVHLPDEEEAKEEPHSQRHVDKAVQDPQEECTLVIIVSKMGLNVRIAHPHHVDGEVGHECENIGRPFGAPG